MSNSPTDVAQQALDAIGSSVVLGDIEEGTREAQVLLRAYGQCLRQLLRAAHWNFARQQSPMLLLADATGQTPYVGTLTITPWIYEYAYPDNCMKARFVPYGPQGLTPSVPYGNIVPPNNTSPVTPNFSAPAAGARLRPARFLEAMDTNYPPATQEPNYAIQGVSPQGRTVICTNVQNAQLVYTALMNYPSNWDSQFRAAFVAYLAAEVALPLWASRNKEKFGIELRATNMKIAAEKIMAARLTVGNEGFTNSDFTPDWMRYRNTGGGWHGAQSQTYGELGGGIYYSGCDACCGLSNTSAF